MADLRMSACPSSSCSRTIPASAHLGGTVSITLPGLFEFLLYLILVVLIGAVNLWVSFGLALYVALKSRGTRIGALERLLVAYGSRIRAHPRELLFPPRAESGPGSSPG
jgi:site-specific recombinase